MESNCLKQWHLPGLLLIGDAAHAMSPVGGVGINYAIQDAVVAANELTQALKPNVSFQPPALFRLPLLRNIPGRIIGFGLRRVHVRQFGDG